MSKIFKRLHEKVRVYLHITKASGIARRYFVMHGFDGAMTAFGIVLGSWIANVSKPEIILLAGLGASLAMGFSGFFAFRTKVRREGVTCEKWKMQQKQGCPIHYEAARFITFYVALIDGLSPTLTATISLRTFILVIAGLTSISNAYIIS